MSDCTHVDGTAVYRYYDEHDILIYAGITGRGTRRNSEHSRRADWWPLVARQEVEHLPGRRQALDREAELIRRHSPPFNVQLNESAEAVRRAYLSSVERVNVTDPIEVQFARLGKRLPLAVIEQRNAEGHLTLATSPEDWTIARRMTTSKQVGYSLSTSLRCGHLIDMRAVGVWVFLTVATSQREPVAYAYAGIKMPPTKPAGQIINLHRIVGTSAS